MDQNYIEYNPAANTFNDGCNTLVVEGCTDPAYTEYDASANTNDGSCTTPVVEGCTDSDFQEYDASANTDDGSCATPVSGCTVPAGDLTAYEVAYPVTTTDFGGTAVSGYVVDLYVDLPTDNDVLLNVYNMSLTPSNPVGTYFQGLTAPGWAPNEQGSIFSTGASQSFDSFIAIGGVTASDADGNPLQMSGNGVAVDPNFGGNNANSPGASAGWYNGNPPNPIGQSVALTGAGLDGIHGVFIGRFAVANATELSLAGSTFEVTWNTGLGTPGQQQKVTVCGDSAE